MKIIKKLILGLFLLLLLSSILFKYRENIPISINKIYRPILSNLLWKVDPYHEIRTTPFGDSQKNTIQRFLVNREESAQLHITEKDTGYFREKWKYGSLDLPAPLKIMAKPL